MSGKFRFLPAVTLCKFVVLAVMSHAQITGVTAGTDLTGGGTKGNVTINVDTTKVPQLGSNNSFTGTESITGIATSMGFLDIASTAVPKGDGQQETVFNSFGAATPASLGLIGPYPNYNIDGFAVAGTQQPGNPDYESGNTNRNFDGYAAYLTSGASSYVQGYGYREQANVAGFFANVKATAPGAAVWGANYAVTDDGVSSDTNLTGLEIDIGSSGSPMFVQAYTVEAGGEGTAPDGSVAYLNHNTGGSFKLTNSFVSDVAAADVALVANPVAYGNSQPSQPVNFTATDSAGSYHTASIFAGVGTPTGSCSVGSLYSNTTATSASTVLYVCHPANTWNAVTIQ
jgi:hypothetical protein